MINWIYNTPYYKQHEIISSVFLGIESGIVSLMSEIGVELVNTSTGLPPELLICTFLASV